MVVVKKNKVICGDCLEEMPKLEANSIDSVVTDPPYGLAFMSESWDKFTPKLFQDFSYKWGLEALRILKPGGYCLAFSGTRTYHRMVCGLEDAGFKIKDCLCWLYGCLSEDTEILTLKGWERYHRNIYNSPILCYNYEKNIFIFDKPRRVFIYQNKHPAYRIKSDFTDQIVSRNHRCLIEREGRFIFQRAETLQSEENIPFLESLQDLPETIFNLQSYRCEKKRSLLKRVYKQEAQRSKKTIQKTNRTTQRKIKNSLFSMWKGILSEYQMDKENKTTCLFSSMQRSIKRNRMGKIWSSRKSKLVRRNRKRISQENKRFWKSLLERWSNIFQNTWKLYWNKICSMSKGIFTYGAQRWLCNGTSFNNGSIFKSLSCSRGSSTSYQSQSYGQSIREPSIIQKQSNTQVIRRTKARIEEIEYNGNVWCVEVSTGVFIARRNGKIFITGNSGFPKSLDISKAIDSYYGLEREKIKIEGNKVRNPKTLNGGRNGNKGATRPFIEKAKEVGYHEIEGNIPITIEAKKWNGWGTGLKPAVELIVVAQKPLCDTYAENTLKYGCGGLNIDACRIQYQPSQETDNRIYDKTGKNITHGKHINFPSTIKYAHEMFKQQKGRWPSNLLLQHHPLCKLVGSKQVGSNDKRLYKKAGIKTNTIYGHRNTINSSAYGIEIAEAWECHLDCPVYLLDKQSGELISGGISKPYIQNPELPAGISYIKKGSICSNLKPKSRGGASRFFYSGKAYKSERNAGLDNLETIPNTEMLKRKEGSAGIENARAGAGRCKGAKNNISTLKPINAMRYLVRLVTPPNGIVLDPFTGSGTTGIACLIEGFNYILIEKRKRFANLIIPKRLEYWKDPKNWSILKDHNALPKIKELKNKKTNRTMEEFLN